MGDLPAAWVQAARLLAVDRLHVAQQGKCLDQCDGWLDELEVVSETPVVDIAPSIVKVRNPSVPHHK